ncbi:MAG TPA: DUF4097 family beta strand repeat-containing protein [Blastocatellia bacterium]|nr:DUF4097 family beta strand repeat-containing protein [Blastocatellia bacterium]
MGTLLGLLIVSTACAHRSRAAEYREDLAVKDEIQRTYQLNKNAKVEIAGINGLVEIKTADTNQADVRIILSAMRREDIDRSRITVEYNPDGLKIKGDNRSVGNHLYGIFSSRGNTRQRVILTLPRQVQLATRGVNGRVNIGEIDGEVHLDGINGNIKVEQAVGSLNLSGINGNIDAIVANLDTKGIRVNGINGNIELRFKDDVNARIDVSGINGRVHADLPNVQVQGQPNRSNYHAVIGTGGSAIDVNGVNGNIRLKRNTEVVASSPETTTKSLKKYGE